MITLCKTCGTSYEVTGAHPEQCDICQDERQYVPASGQEWVDFTALMFQENEHGQPGYGNPAQLHNRTKNPISIIGQ